MMAKIILTESQKSFLLEKEMLDNIFLESLNESKGFDGLKDKIRKALLAGVALTSIIAAIMDMKMTIDAKRELAEYAKTESAADNAYAQKVRACRGYMQYALKNQGYTMNDTGLRPETLVSASINNSFDLPFLMAAAHQESCFGANNRAQRTNSVFSVGSYDNNVDAVTYSDPNDSVEGYLNLLFGHYLLNGKTINDLMTPGGFVNEIGKRYAKDPNYEENIKNVRNRIIRMYPELASI